MGRSSFLYPPCELQQLDHVYGFVCGPLLNKPGALFVSPYPGFFLKSSPVFDRVNCGVGARVYFGEGTNVRTLLMWIQSSDFSITLLYRT